MDRIGQSNGTGKIGREQRLSRREIVFPAHATKNWFFGRHNYVPYLSVPSLLRHQTYVKHSSMWSDSCQPLRCSNCFGNIPTKARSRPLRNWSRHSEDHWPTRSRRPAFAHRLFSLGGVLCWRDHRKALPTRDLQCKGRNRTGFGASVAPARSILTPALTGPPRDRLRNRL
jgi:hypothetical protein